MVHNQRDIIDKDYKELCAEMYAEGHSFFTYISDSADSLASCCFRGDTEVLWKDGGGIHTTTFEELYNLNIQNIQVPQDGTWVDATPVRTANTNFYRVRVNNRTDLYVTDNHIHITKDGEKTTIELKVGDLLKRDASPYVLVTAIEKVDCPECEYSYCVECKDQTKPYFTLPNGIVTHNCRLRNELAENTFNPTSGLTGVMTGSCNVITLNISRIVQDWFNQESNVQWVDHTKWFDYAPSLSAYLTRILERVYKYHIAYKTMLYEMEEKEMFAASNGGYIFIKKLYSTIGLNGLNEAARFLGMEVSNNPSYVKFLQTILSTVKEQNKLHSIHDGKRPFLFNSEVVPAEGLGGKNYNWDKEDGYWVPNDINLYNSYFYNAHDDTSVIDKFILHGHQTYQYTDGGSAAHINLDDHLTKPQLLKLIDFAIAEGTNYFTFNIPNSKCEDCGHIVKKPIDTCPKCGSKNITQYTRIIGYLRPIKAFGADRQIEAAKRTYSNGREELC